MIAVTLALILSPHTARLSFAPVDLPPYVWARPEPMTFTDQRKKRKGKQ
jgi:hypothetical protein